jgi:hypothetical protein
MDWIDLAQNKVLRRTCEHGDETWGSIKCWEFVE